MTLDGVIETNIAYLGSNLNGACGALDFEILDYDHGVAISLGPDKIRAKLILKLNLLFCSLMKQKLFLI
jgi:hypothetical protein